MKRCSSSTPCPPSTHGLCRAIVDGRMDGDDFYTTLACQLIRQVRGRRSQSDLSRRAGYKSNMVQRWEAGECSPHVETFLELCKRQRIDVSNPIAVLRALDLSDYQRRGWKQTGWLARKLGIDSARVDEALLALEASGQVRRKSGRWQVREVVSINTGGDPVRARQLKASWAEEAAARLCKGDPGLFGYTVFAASHEDMHRLRQLQLEFVQAMEAVLAQSKASECVGLYCVQLLDLDAGPRNSLRPTQSRPGRRLNTP